MAEDVRKVLTREQLCRGAGGIAYRVEQLVHVTLIPNCGARHQRDATAISNARVESVLVNARALSYFLTAKPHDRRNLHATHYSITAWEEAIDDDLTPVAEAIIRAASHHLAHSSIGDETSEPHPGDWPLFEIALALSGAMATFLATLNRRHPDRAAMFTPTPIRDYEMISNSDLLKPTEISNNPRVGALTKAVQAYLGWAPDETEPSPTL